MGTGRMHEDSLLWLTVAGYGLLTIAALSAGVYVILSLVRMLAAGW